jgi:hypothetical protein
VRGISTRETSLGFHVIRLHYSADPDKDPETEAGRVWLAQAKQGMSESRWRKEYEVDYGALGGERVFPELDPSVHIIEPFDLDMDAWTVWMACDPHPRTPHAFVWLAVNSEGDMVILFSYWPASAVTPDYRATCKHYADAVEYYEEDSKLKVYKRLMDVAGKAFNASEEHSYFEAYRDAGLPFYPAKKNRDFSGFELINAALQPLRFQIGDEITTRPRLRIFKGNEELCYQISHLRFDEWKGAGMAAEKDPPERVREQRKHLVDCLAYILLDEPCHIAKRKFDDFQHIYPSTAY